MKMRPRNSLNVWIQIHPSSSYFSFTSIHPYIAQGMWKCLGVWGWFPSRDFFCFSQAHDIILIICPVTIYIAKFRCMMMYEKNSKMTWTQFQYFIVSWLWRACCTRKKHRTNKNRPHKQWYQTTTKTKPTTHNQHQITSHHLPRVWVIYPNTQRMVYLPACTIKTNQV